MQLLSSMARQAAERKKHRNLIVGDGGFKLRRRLF